MLTDAQFATSLGTMHKHVQMLVAAASATAEITTPETAL